MSPKSENTMSDDEEDAQDTEGPAPGQLGPASVTAGIPSSILASHPELEAVGAALEAHRLGLPITARCPQCGAELTVESTDEALVVRCANGHQLFRARRTR
jgi:hypothetical protein